MNDKALEELDPANPELQELLRERRELIRAINYWETSDRVEAPIRVAEFSTLLAELEDEILSIDRPPVVDPTQIDEVVSQHKARESGIDREGPLNDETYRRLGRISLKIEGLFRETNELMRAIDFWKASDTSEEAERVSEFEQLLEKLDEGIQSLAEWFPDRNQEMNHRNWRLSCREKTIHTVSTCAALSPYR